MHMFYVWPLPLYMPQTTYLILRLIQVNFIIKWSLRYHLKSKTVMIKIFKYFFFLIFQNNVWVRVVGIYAIQINNEWNLKFEKILEGKVYHTTENIIQKFVRLNEYTQHVRKFRSFGRWHKENTSLAYI